MIPVTEQRRKQLLNQSQPLKQSNGVRLGSDTTSYVPASFRIRPLRDQLIVEPLAVIYSRHVYVHRDTKPLRGIVKAAGPGRYELGYKDAQGQRTYDRNKRKAIYETNTWVPMSLKVGDVIEVGGAEQEGYSWETFYWGDTLHFHCTERDVCGIRDITEAEARREAFELERTFDRAPSGNVTYSTVEFS